ncbi:hypothetical protein Pint_33584 [Pistacia integerrima]|uniref:Uncharacterized protein n=1 Tax=Pistacia integerrima TaxID=434235 RepID=A0ACC0X465_9ROSI|nr:hypothetical protein Pint_33584 [Pistacia integerrima]
MASGMVHFQVLELSQSICDKWIIKMKALPKSQDTSKNVEKGYKEPEDKMRLPYPQKDTLKDSRKRDKKTIFTTYQALDDDEFENISNATTAKL